MRRLFLALDVPAAVRTALAALGDEALDGARWTRPEQFHLTLRFLGDTPDERVPGLEAALRAIRAPPLRLRLERLTVFPSRRRPRVIVARTAPSEPLLALHRRIERAVQPLGFDPESQPFRPHVTLARLKRPDARAVHAYLQRSDVDAAFTAEAFRLYASALRPTGAVHERLASFALRSEEGG